MSGVKKISRQLLLTWYNQMRMACVRAISWWIRPRYPSNSTPSNPVPMSTAVGPCPAINSLSSCNMPETHKLPVQHLNNGACPKCITIRDTYPGFNAPLWVWFSDFQKLHPEFHMSCAGRGKIDQNALFARHATKASWGHSAHNFNCAFDSFVLVPGKEDIYPVEWYNSVLAPALPAWISWLGRPGSPFPELPHLEILAWVELRRSNLVQLVE